MAPAPVDQSFCQPFAWSRAALYAALISTFQTQRRLYADFSTVAKVLLEISVCGFAFVQSAGPMPASSPQSGTRRLAACFTCEACRHDLVRRLAYGRAVRLPVLRADQARRILTARRIRRLPFLIKHWKQI
ncbi:hypothetical protein [Caballeronia glathei]|uniref:hypothetical protein n=1 Tax=Caballeronia glathei TaxID=60547 RepID=UPI001E35F6A8|nr:hypothetical protein [Caballeronia glathei]